MSFEANIHNMNGTKGEAWLPSFPHRIIEISVSFGFFGALFGSRPVGILNEMMGWKNVIWILFAASLALAVLFLICMPNQKDTTNQRTTSSLADLCELLKNKHVWAVSLLSGLMAGPLEGFADAWGVPFLQTVYGIEQANAQFLPSLVFFGFGFGAPVIGYLGEKYKKPYTILIISALFMALIFIGMLLFNLKSVAFLYTLMITIGVLCAYQIFIILGLS
jgi:predicted MFS family arabinose efflux permease